MLSLFKCFNLSILSVTQGVGRLVKSPSSPVANHTMGISDEIEATTIVIDEGTILEIKRRLHSFRSTLTTSVVRRYWQQNLPKSALQLQNFCFAY